MGAMGDSLGVIVVDMILGWCDEVKELVLVAEIVSKLKVRNHDALEIGNPTSRGHVSSESGYRRLRSSSTTVFGCGPHRQQHPAATCRDK